ncbi:MAG: RsmE family RNA methyltransferase [Patescibacteria group bacterium]
MQRFFLAPQDFTESAVRISQPEIVHQMKNVLRMKPGARFIALDNLGFEFECKINDISDSQIDAQIVEKRVNAAEPQLFVILYQAMPKKMELFEMILQKCTEIGVSEFVPMFSEFCERESLSKRERLARILREAAEQCERGKIPTLKKEIKFAEALNQDLSFPVLLHSRGENSPLRLQTEKANQIKRCEIFIGPEGGFSEKEVNAAQSKNFRICSLNSRILRTETSAISAATILLQ